MGSIKNKIKNVFFPVIFYIIIIQIPTALLLFVFNILQFPSYCNYIFNSVFCFFVASIFTIIFFVLVSLLPRVLLNIVVLLIYTLSGTFLYFLINYRKLYDADVLKNFFTVGVELVGEFMSFQLFLFIVASFICGIISLKIKSAKLLGIAKIISFAFVCIFFVLLIAGIGKFKFSQSLVVINAYMPFAAITETVKYFNNYNNFLKIKERKKDISKLYKYKFTNKGKEPLVVVMCHCQLKLYHLC